MKKNKRIAFLLRLSLVLSVILVFILCFTSFVSQTVAKKNINVSKMEVQSENLSIQKKPVIDKYKGQKPKIAYLTFDDGPNKSTDKILDILQKENIPATFFIVGSAVNQNNKSSVKRMADEGHYVGAHSMTHNYQLLYDNRTYINEMLKVQDIIEDITGTRNLLVRSPYGSQPGMVQDIRNEAVKNHMKVWDWTVDSLDWNLSGKPEGIIQNIKKQTKDKVEVILLHDRETTVDALPDIIQYLRSEGYIFKAYNEKEHFMVNFWYDARL